METVRDTINKSIEEAFIRAKLNIDEFNHDITAYNETGTKCMAIYDKSEGCGRSFVIVGLQPNLSGSFKVMYFKNTTKQAGCYDAIDAMADAGGWMNS